MEPRRTNRIYLWITIAIIVIIGGYVAYDQFINVGTVTVTVPEGTTVFVDNNEEIASTNTATESLRLKSGEHTIIVSKEGFWPWAKVVNVQTNEETALSPFMVGHTADGTFIDEANPEYDALIAQTDAVIAPKETARLASPAATVEVWVEDNAIFAEWVGGDSLPRYFCDESNTCNNTIEVFSSSEPIKNVAFYKDRNDVLLVAVDTAINVIEIDKKEFQNIQPLYQGISPTFVVTEGGSVILRDQDAIMEVAL